MRKTVPFQTLHDLAQKAMDDAFVSVGQALTRQKAAEDQLIKLQQYRHDYVHSLQQSLSRGMLSSQCQNNQRFITTLDEAIAKQSGVLGQTQKLVAQERERWMQQRRKVASMQVLIKRDEKRANITENRREQKADDERAARSHRRLQPA